MLESLRNFLSGKTLIVIAILLAIPFIFLGSTSTGTTFGGYGKVNGEEVTQIDVNLATSAVSQRLQSIYGEDFSLDDLEEIEEGATLRLIKNEVINQKTLLSQAKDLGLLLSEDMAKKVIITLPQYQGDSGFDQSIFESSVRANGFTPEEFIKIVQEGMSRGTLRNALSMAVFPIDSDILKVTSLLETSRDIEFIKVDKGMVVDSQKASLTEGQAFYDATPFLFLSQEKRDFSYIVLNYENYKDQVEVPDGYVEDAYAAYVNDSTQQIQNRISHLMIDKSNYENSDDALKNIEGLLLQIKSGTLSFEDAVKASSDDSASKDLAGDLGLSSGDAFPEEFEAAITSMVLGDISNVVELEDSLHILKLTEILQPEIKAQEEVQQELVDELVQAEALAIMQDDFLRLESMVLEGLTLGALSDAAQQPIAVSGLKVEEGFQLDGFNTVNPSQLFGANFLSNNIEIYENENEYVFLMLTQVIEPAVQAFTDVAELAIREVRVQKAEKLLMEFSKDAASILLGEKNLPENPGFLKDSFKEVKRFSSLLPSEIINASFEAPLGEIASQESFNGDLYWAKSTNQVIPTEEDLADSLEQYSNFYSETLGQDFSGVIDMAFKKGQKVRLKNFNLN